jgi:hypothetical protein
MIADLVHMLKVRWSGWVLRDDYCNWTSCLATQDQRPASDMDTPSRMKNMLEQLRSFDAVDRPYPSDWTWGRMNLEQRRPSIEAISLAASSERGQRLLNIYSRKFHEFFFDESGKCSEMVSLERSDEK